MQTYVEVEAKTGLSEYERILCNGDEHPFPHNTPSSVTQVGAIDCNGTFL